MKYFIIYLSHTNQNQAIMKQFHRCRIIPITSTKVEKNNLTSYMLCTLGYTV